VSFLPVLAYDGSHMTQVDAGGILDIAMAGTSATLLARKWRARCWSMSTTTRSVESSPVTRRWPQSVASKASALWRQRYRDNHQQERQGQRAQEQSEGRRPHGQGEEGTYGGGEGVQVQAEAGSGEADQIRYPHPAFMYLTDFRENTLQDVITKLEPNSFLPSLVSPLMTSIC